MTSNNTFFQPTADHNTLEGIGFRFGAIGTHTSRTIMVEELRSLFGHTGSAATRQDFAHAIINENCLSKETYSTRKLTNQRLGELYGLDSRIALYRILRHLWAANVEGGSLLALLLSLARDPLLRATAPVIAGLPVGAELPRTRLKESIASAVGERMNDSTIEKVQRNAASSWTQSGHLAGRTFKMRQQVKATPASVALALFLADSAGFHGVQAFASPWIELLDCAGSRARELAFEAKRLEYLDLRLADDVVDLDFKRIDPQSKGASWVA
jgi:hypothetical protein